MRELRQYQHVRFRRVLECLIMRSGEWCVVGSGCVWLLQRVKKEAGGVEETRVEGGRNAF